MLMPSAIVIEVGQKWIHFLLGEVVEAERQYAWKVCSLHVDRAPTSTALDCRASRPVWAKRVRVVEFPREFKPNRLEAMGLAQTGHASVQFTLTS